MTSFNGLTTDIGAKLIWDGDDVMIPESMGKARDDQMIGTPLERLAELSGRICYDSLGQGRPTRGVDGKEGYHEHIKSCNHTSVYGHGHRTVTFKFSTGAGAVAAMLCFMNRPGFFLRRLSELSFNVTFNLRSVLQFDERTDVSATWSFTQGYDGKDSGIMAREVSAALRIAAHNHAPAVIPLNGDCLRSTIEVWKAEPIIAAECWVSLHLYGGRGFSHEQVRHGFWTGMSQRSTRYVDESSSPWVVHPLLNEFLDYCYKVNAEIDADGLTRSMEESVEGCRKLYDRIIENMMPWLINVKKFDKFTARKQARGAARNFLGNGLLTELVFSANMAQWLWMFNQRASAAADAEIRQISVAAFKEIQRSKHGHFLKDLHVVTVDGVEIVEPIR